MLYYKIFSYPVTFDVPFCIPSVLHHATARSQVLMASLTLLLLSCFYNNFAIGLSNVSQAIPQLDGLTFEPPDTAYRSITVGGQNWTHCCLLAVNSSFRIDPENSSLEYSSQSFIDGPISVSEFADDAERAGGSFPCGATFDGNFSGAPEVHVPYDWCRSSCDGWQLSHRVALTQWIGPLVGFILPCLAFCLNIPRGQKLSIPPWVFSPSPDGVTAVLSYVFRLAAALILVTLDTITWLCMCFALAGPMLLSAVYEAWIDMRLLHYLWQEIVVNHNLPDRGRTTRFLTLELRAQLLLLIVVGNIDIVTDGEITPGAHAGTVFWNTILIAQKLRPTKILP
jgi:hypothetical protein